MEKLYMLEIFVNKIVFDQLPVPLKRNIVVRATCPNIASLEIMTDVMGALENLEAKERSSKNKRVDIDCGRSVLFPMDAKKMKEVLKKENLEITVSSREEDSTTPIAVAKLPWDHEFINMVDNSITTTGYITPVDLEDDFHMILNNNHAAVISMFIRLSYLGSSVYTNTQRLVTKDTADTGAPGGAPATYLFKSVDNATIFKCTRYGMGSDKDIMPVGAIYNIANKNDPGANPQRTSFRRRQATKSTETLLTLRSNKFSTMSIAPSVFFGMGELDRSAMLQNALASTDSTMSLKPGPVKGQKYMDLTELHMDVSTFSMLANALGMHVYQSSVSKDDFGEDGGEGESGEIYPLFVDYKSLTVKEIEERLCKHPDCPAAKLFKDYGIGPLAKNITGLGGLYNDVEAPCSYGLSHCNGNIDNYGPLGRFRRPKQVEEPFVPQSNCKCGRKSSTISTDSKGSNTSSRSKQKGKSECYTHCPENPMKLKPPLRLKGGAPLGPTCDPVPNPMTMCQDLMDEFNKVLKDYKDALGPCGLATCPFALTLVGDNCAEICNSTDPEYLKRVCNLANPEILLEEKNEFTGCGVPNCPYKRAAISPAEKDYSKYKGMPGCGYAKCPFVKAKLGMEPEEDNHIPAFKDYQKQETYKFRDALPPIHWDCPDPLPKGDCKNPDCPYVKRDALIKKYFPEPCCPCGSPTCPYVCAPCTFPGCPFAIAEPCPPVCPYTQPPPKELKCTASVCPFVRNSDARCENPECPYKIYEDKLAECAAWERQQALQAEEEEEEGEEEPCKPCGRRSSRSARCSSLRTSIASTSKIQSSTRRSDTIASSKIERASEPCILSGAAEKRDSRSVPCKPDTCGKGDKVCDVCNSDKTDKKETITKKSVDLTSKSSKYVKVEKSAQPLITKQSLKGVTDEDKNVNPNGILKRPHKEGSISAKKPLNTVKIPKPTKASKNAPKRAPKGRPMLNITNNPCPLSKMCKKFPFRYDRKSYKPCTKIGHRDCVLPKFLVPKCMGWLWNIHEDICGLRPRRGWKPGAVSKMIAFRMDYFNAMREKRPFGHSQSKHDEIGRKPSLPTVQVNKKGGVVNVTMHPIKEPAEIKKVGDGNPYMDCTPIQFKITKNNPEKQAKYCYCGDQLSDTDSSELDIEFSPPGAMINPRLMHKNELIEEEVQYDINDIPIPPKPPKAKGGLWTYFQKKLMVLKPISFEINLSISSLFYKEDAVLRLRGGSDYPCHDIPISVKDVIKGGNANNIARPGRVLRLRGGGPMRNQKHDPLKIQMPSVQGLCKDLMSDYNKVMDDYKKALGPCGTATCPFNYNVREEECKKVCQVTCPQPYCPPKLGPCTQPICPHLPEYSNAEDYEDEVDLDEYKACYESCVAPRPDGQPAVPCRRSVCPFGSTTPELCPTWECPQLEDCNIDTCITPTDPCDLQVEDTKKKKPIRCHKHICPYKMDELTVDDVNPFSRKIKSKKGCGSPDCPHSNKYQAEPEVVMPVFPCKRPCPSIDDLPPIHWDCPDPLPKGECTNPFCPLREKLPCGHCPIDARHCGMPGCQFAGDSICPPTCPYTQKNPPKDLECRPSVCPLARPEGYVNMPFVPRKDKPCGDQCPYAKGNKKKKGCGNPKCPYQTCMDRDGLNAQEDCGNPMCPYRIAAKKRAEKEKERAKSKKQDELEGTFLSLSSPLAEPPQTKTPSAVTAVSLPSGKEERPSIKAETLRKSGAKMSTQGILKLIKSSMQNLTAVSDSADPTACRELSCAQFMGTRVCKKCQQRQREAEATGTDLKTLATKKSKVTAKSKNKPRKKRKARGYVYDKGTYYPGVKFGHKDCKRHPHRVPWDMGWRWNLHQPYTQLKPRAGWRPGAIGKTILKFINHERKKLGLPPRPMIRNALPKMHYSKSASDLDLLSKVRRSRTRLSVTRLSKPKPTLTIKKKDGVVYVTMNPLKDPSTMEPNEYPYLDCSPLEFKISKKKQDDEFKKCLCSGDDPDGTFVSQDESSELDIEFTPPAGIVRPEYMSKRKHICHTESQYDKKDLPKSESNLKEKGGKKGKKSQKSKKGKKGKKKK